MTPPYTVRASTRRASITQPQSSAPTSSVLPNLSLSSPQHHYSVFTQDSAHLTKPSGHRRSASHLPVYAVLVLLHICLGTASSPETPQPNFHTDQTPPTLNNMQFQLAPAPAVNESGPAFTALPGLSPKPAQPVSSTFEGFSNAHERQLAIRRSEKSFWWPNGVVCASVCVCISPLRH